MQFKCYVNNHCTLLLWDWCQGRQSICVQYRCNRFFEYFKSPLGWIYHHCVWGYRRPPVPFNLIEVEKSWTKRVSTIWKERERREKERERGERQREGEGERGERERREISWSLSKLRLIFLIKRSGQGRRPLCEGTAPTEASSAWAQVFSHNTVQGLAQRGSVWKAAEDGCSGGLGEALVQAPPAVRLSGNPEKGPGLHTFLLVRLPVGNKEQLHGQFIGPSTCGRISFCKMRKLS